MTSESTQEEKQIFLRENILEKGYDANSFVEFLIGKKGEEGADVGNWTMDDLKVVVKEFISLQNNNNNKINSNQEAKNQEINPTNFNKNKIKNSNNPLENNLSLNKSHVKYDPLSGGIDKKEENTNQNLNQQTNQQNSSMKNFFVNNNVNKNNNQTLNNNSNPQSNTNFPTNNTNQNMQINPQLQFLQQYLNLLKAQNPQFQNNLQQQYGLQNPQQNQINTQNNFQTNTINTNSSNNSKNNNLLTNPVNSNKQQNISNTPQSPILVNAQTTNTEKNEKDKDTNKDNNKDNNKDKDKDKEQASNKNIIQENQSNVIVNQPEKNKNNNNDNKEEEKDIDTSIAYGIITNVLEDTKLVDQTPLTMEPNPIIQVGFPEKVEGGFFTKSYVTYLITTNPLNLKVRRRYSDFDWLRQMIQNLYFWNVIPTTPRKNRFGGDKFGEPFLQKRMRTLEKFLNYCLMNPIIKCSKLFYDFISIEKEEDFQKTKKEYEKIKPAVNINEFKTQFGKANIQINKKKEIYYENIKDNISINENLLIKLNTNFKSLKTQIDNLTTIIDEITKIFDELNKNSIKYFDGEYIIKSYENMNKLFSNWSETLKRHNKILNIDLREYFKYTKNIFKSMKDLVYSVENNKNTYLKNLRYLINKKEDLFKRGDTNKWDLNIQDRNNLNNLVRDKSLAVTKILPKETVNVIGMKKTYGFYLNRILEEYERIRAINSNNHKKTIINVCEKIIEIYGDFQKGIVDIINILNNNNNTINKTIVNEENTKKE